MFSDLVAGDSLSFEAMINTSAPGALNATSELNFTDVAGTDQTLTINLSGLVELTDEPMIPNLIYHAETGEVILDPDGADGIIGYSLTNTTGSFLPGGHTPALGGVATSSVIEFAEASFNAITSQASIGNVFPVGLDITELFNLLDGNQVSRGLGTNLVPFDLVVIPVPVPEPSTYLIAATGLLGIGCVCLRRKTGRR